MNEYIDSIELHGDVLDVGGGERAEYRDLLDPNARIVSVNFDPAIEPSVLCDLRAGLPFEDATFDVVISFNTLEHVMDVQQVVSELVRVLRPGGEMHVLVPFLFRVHGSPYDFHRYTPWGWSELLHRAGLPPGDIEIEPLVWDPVATAWSLADLALSGRVWKRARPVIRAAILYRPILTHRLFGPSRCHDPEVNAEYAVAYAIRGHKRRREP